MYLLDTNIVAFYFRGNKNVVNKINEIGLNKCSISEITIAELKYGAAKSNKPDFHNEVLNTFSANIDIISIIEVLDSYAFEKVRLKKAGNRIDDFDLLIGATAIANELILVTNNTKHLQRMSLKNIEDWTI